MTPLLIAGAGLLIAALVAQVLIPRIGEARIERHLAQNGGEAFVALDAVPALTLLRQEGQRIAVRGRRIEIGMSGEGGGLSALDGFDEVDIVLTDFSTGPFEIAELELKRSGSGPYLLRSKARTSGVDLLDYGGSQFGLIGSPLLATLAKQAPLGARSFPVAVAVELRSEAGVVTIASGGGTIGGYPAGPIATALAAAVARRLEIAY